MFSEKYRPKSLKEFAGNAAALGTIEKFLTNWKKGKGLVVAGQQGVGKTTAIELFAKERGLFLVHTDASDKRSAKTLKDEFAHSIGQQSLFHKGKLILFDEVDALSGNSDRGAPAEIAKMIETSPFPIIIIANDLYSKKLPAIKKVCATAKFTKVYTATIENKLKEICEKENISYDERAIKSIAMTADGDLKAAINDLEASITEEGLKKGNTDNYRDSEKAIYDTLKIILKTTNIRTAKEAMLLSDKPPEEMLQWIRENVGYEYQKKQELADAFDFLSKADKKIGQIRRQQYWRFMAYASDLMAGGVASAKKERYTKFYPYKYPSKIAKLGKSRFTRAKDDKLAAALAEKLHCSKKRSKDYLPLLAILEQKKPHEYAELWNELGLGI